MAAFGGFMSATDSALLFSDCTAGVQGLCSLCVPGLPVSQPVRWGHSCEPESPASWAAFAALVTWSGESARHSCGYSAAIFASQGNSWGPCAWAIDRALESRAQMGGACLPSIKSCLRACWIGRPLARCHRCSWWRMLSHWIRQSSLDYIIICAFTDITPDPKALIELFMNATFSYVTFVCWSNCRLEFRVSQQKSFGFGTFLLFSFLLSHHIFWR